MNFKEFIQSEDPFDEPAGRKTAADLKQDLDRSQEDIEYLADLWEKYWFAKQERQEEFQRNGPTKRWAAAQKEERELAKIVWLYDKGKVEMAKKLAKERMKSY